MIKALCTLLIILYSSLSLAKTQIIYVQSEKAKIKQEPNAKSADLFEVNRGDILDVIEANGLWLKIKVKNKDGWISKIFTSPNKPVGQSDLLKKTDESIEKVSRKRTSSYSVAASTRGLVASNRNRANAKKYRANFQSLEELEEQKINASEIEDFIKKGKLSQ